MIGNPAHDGQIILFIIMRMQYNVVNNISFQKEGLPSHFRMQRSPLRSRRGWSSEERSQQHKKMLYERMIDKRKRKLLIIECNVHKLKVQGLSFSETLTRAASLILPNNLIYLIQTKDRESIPTQFAEAKQISSYFSVIAIIGHSNSIGIQFGENELLKWESLSNWVKPFRPQKLFIMSCQGGKTEVTKILFKNLDSLKEVYGSPVFLSKPDAITIAGVALADLFNAKSSIDMLPVAQIISILHKGFIWKIARGDDEPTIERELTEKIIIGLQNSMRNR